MAILSKIKSAAKKVVSAVKSAVTKAPKTASVASSKVSYNPNAKEAISIPKSSTSIAQSTPNISVKTSKSVPSSALNTSAKRAVSNAATMDFPVASGSMSIGNAGVARDLGVYQSQKSSLGSGSSSVNSLSRNGVYNAPVTSAYSSTKTSSSPSTSSITTSPIMGSTGGSMAGKLPQVPAPTNYTGLTNNYSTLTGVTNIDGTQKDTTGTAEATTPDMQSKAFVDLMKTVQPQEPERVDREKIMEEAGLTQALKDQQALANKISAITAQKEAQLLQLRGVAGTEGVTEAVYGGQQAQIERESAIKLLPLTAQYEAASNNVQAAKELVANFIADENNYQTRLYQYQSNLYNKIWDYATDQQKTALEEKRHQEDKQYADEKEFRNQQYKLAELDLDNTGGKNLGSIFGSQNYDELESVYSRVQKNTQVTGEYPTTITGKPMTDAQATSYGYAQRLEESDSVINSIGSKFAGARSYIGQVLPNILKTDDRQKFEQAQRNFINSVLRKESGAVISEEEFQNARQQYFPQPGDSDAVLEQKKSNRDTIISNFYRQAGVQRQGGSVTTPEDLRSKYNY